MRLSEFQDLHGEFRQFVEQDFLARDLGFQTRFLFLQGVQKVHDPWLPVGSGGADRTLRAA
ncbi:hypothetical protein CODIS_11270 [Candidatus Thiodiazotropha endolucinida]|uniref:Uncharacterized protein n=1 Tax=Candidatus Thiodiazotropha endolucinida TaxID=1655433 RepID=A0A7Z0VMT0_9GAMM|nr:hypothetical protein CODIS_11270 [Candidatus Thiodiazotropha endolucinida]